MAELIDFLLVDGFSALAFFSAVEPLRVANRLAPAPLYGWRLLSPDGEPVAASSGMRLIADAPLSAADHARTLIVCTGFHPERALGRAGLSQLRRFARSGGRFGALDTGVELLARAGLAGDGPVAIHWEAAPDFAARWPHIAVADALYTIGEQLFTCAGGTAALDMMLERIAGVHGRRFANAVAEQFIHERIRPAEAPQRMAPTARLGTGSRALVAAIELIDRSIDAPPTTAAIARHAAVTPRQLERLFRRHLGQSPQQFARRQRLNEARRLLASGDGRVLDAALATGFDTASALARAYRREFGTAPGTTRRDG